MLQQKMPVSHEKEVYVVLMQLTRLTKRLSAYCVAGNRDLYRQDETHV